MIWWLHVVTLATQPVIIITLSCVSVPDIDLSCTVTGEPGIGAVSFQSVGVWWRSQGRELCQSAGHTSSNHHPAPHCQEAASSHLLCPLQTFQPYPLCFFTSSLCWYDWFKVAALLYVSISSIVTRSSHIFTHLIVCVYSSSFSPFTCPVNWMSCIMHKSHNLIF